MLEVDGRDDSVRIAASGLRVLALGHAAVDGLDDRSGAADERAVAVRQGRAGAVAPDRRVRRIAEEIVVDRVRAALHLALRARRLRAESKRDCVSLAFGALQG